MTNLFLQTLSRLFLFFTMYFLSCNMPSDGNALERDNNTIVSNTIKIAKNNNERVIHIFVALCDNEHQGIIKVPPIIGNGKDPDNNLYWGCGYGTKSFLKQQKNWTLVQSVKNPKGNVLERCVFKHKTADVYVVADAYDGEFIQKCITDFLESCSGDFNDYFMVGKDSVACGGNSNLTAYVGHDGLMEFQIEENILKRDTLKRETIILACKSKRYFEPYLIQTGAKPIVWTTGLMSPEAYTLVAAIDSWVSNQNEEAIREAAAQAYDKYQKCGIAAARNLLVSD